MIRLINKDNSTFIADLIGYKGQFIWDKSKPDGTLLKRLDCSHIKSRGCHYKTALKKGIDLASIDYLEKIFESTYREEINLMQK